MYLIESVATLRVYPMEELSHTLLSGAAYIASDGTRWVLYLNQSRRPSGTSLEITEGSTVFKFTIHEGLGVDVQFNFVVATNSILAGCKITS